jgi:O-antigen ligase
VALVDAIGGGRRFLDAELADLTRTPPGPLCWLAAVAFSGALLLAAVLSAHASGFLVAALLAVMSALFLVRPLAAVALVIVVHESVDLWANGQLESIGGLQFNLTTGLTLLVVLVGGAYVAEQWSSARRAPSVIAFLLFGTIAAISLVHAPALTEAIPEVLRIARIGVIYTLVFVLVRTRRDIELILIAQFASIVPVIGVAIYQTFTGSDYHTPGIGQFQFDRATGGFDGPDELGIILGVMLCAAIPVLFGGRVRWWPALLIWTALAMTALVGSYTRTGWISLIAGLLVIGAVRYRSLLVFVPLAVAIVVLAVPSTVQRFNDLTNGGESSAEYGNTFGDRLSLWHENLPKVNQSPVIGNGLASIDAETGRLPHSDYVRAAVETGLLGFCAFVTLMLSGLIGASRALVRARNESPAGLLTSVCVAGVGISVAYILISADSNLMTKPVVAGAIWVFLALAHRAGEMAPDRVAWPVRNTPRTTDATLA